MIFSFFQLKGCPEKPKHLNTGLSFYSSGTVGVPNLE